MIKKFLMFLLCVLSACALTTDAGNGLNRLNQEPNNCEFLYTINSNATAYDIDDAYEYLEKSIIDQDKQGDSYYIVKQETVNNPSAIFGPKQTYKFKTKVYNCSK